MQIVLDILIFISAFGLVIWGGDRFVDSSVAIAKKIKIPTIVIGATLTSVGTTLPELLVTIFSSAGSAGSMALGNALGSIIFNTAFIGGVLLLFAKIKVKKDSFALYVLMIFSIALCEVMAIN